MGTSPPPPPLPILLRLISKATHGHFTTTSSTPNALRFDHHYHHQHHYSPPRPLPAPLHISAPPLLLRFLLHHTATWVHRRPANFVFLIWPIIGALQLAAVLFSAARRGPPLKQSELSALSLANVCATTWLLISSNSAPGALPIWSCFVLPLVPIISGYPLRVAEQPPTGLYALVFQIFSSFTTLASLVALTVELQYGGRIPFLAGKAELCALIFASLAGVVVSLPGRTAARRCVNLLALVGIVFKRLAAGGALLLSPSFLALLGCLGVAAKQLVAPSADADGGAPS